MCEAGRKADRPPGDTVYLQGSLRAWLSQEGDESKLPGSGEAAERPGWAFGHLRAETLAVPLPCKSLPSEALEPRGHAIHKGSWHEQQTQLILAPLASALSHSQLPTTLGPLGPWVHQGRTGLPPRTHSWSCGKQPKWAELPSSAVGLRNQPACYENTCPLARSKGQAL